MKVRDIPIGESFKLDPVAEGLVFLLADDQCGKATWVRTGEQRFIVNGEQLFEGEDAEFLLELECTMRPGE